MKTAVITGASRGIGLATAKLFLENGWQVIGTFNKTDIPIKNDKLAAVRLDLASPKEVNHIAEQIKKQVKTVDILVNNAGIVLDGRDENIDVDKIRIPCYQY
jgi:NAD(P)-dependent dehydrogenase (short-subunit alcohol dehydrogenase family)